jgi:peptidyl-prolyl cis-trans isomerase B (cyclophilin B)
VAGKKERQRKLARERYQRQQTRRAQQARRWRTSVIIGVACVAVIGLGVGAYFLFQGGGKSASAASATPSATASATPSSTASPAAAAAAAEPATHCTYTSSPPAARNVGVPPATPDSKATYRATIVTNRGDVVIDLLNAKATCTVNSFVYLAGKSYFSNTHCHRLTTIAPLYVLQCGDPTGTGSGGPGYKFGSENLAGATYPLGTVAMAHPGGTAGDTENGSQFFVVYRNTSLPADYTPFGTVVKGLGIIQNVAKAGIGTGNASSPGDGPPREKVVIKRVIIKKT